MNEEKKAHADELAENSRGNIKSERLVSTGTGGLLSITPNNYLHDQAIIKYFKQYEQPHYFFYNEASGVQISGTTIKSGWSGDYRNSMWVTDQGIHFTVGQSDGDFHSFIPYDLIDSIECRDGMTKNKFIFQTSQGEVIFPTDPATNVLDDAGRYIRSQLPINSKTTDRSEDSTREDSTREDSTREDSTDAWANREFSSLSAEEFENLVLEIFSGLGYEVATPSGNDWNGVDIIARNTYEVISIQIEYKNDGKVTQQAIQQSIGAMAQVGADKAVTISLSGFTRGAIKTSEDLGDTVELINKDIIRQLLYEINKSRSDNNSDNKTESSKTTSDRNRQRNSSQSQNITETEAYKILNIEPPATQEEIRTQYREKVKQVHPDTGGTIKEFKKTQEAYSILSNK